MSVGSLLVLLLACNPDPGEVDEQVGYRDNLDEGPSSGERGNIIISEILWAGSVTDDGTWDQGDVFVEIRNQGSLPVDVEGWHLELEGTVAQTWRLPDVGRLEVNEQVFFAAKTSGCFPEPDGVIGGLELPFEDPFQLTLRDADERLIEPAGSRTVPPFAGTYDLVVARSMERIQLMFGDRGTQPHSWHHYTNDVPVDVPNNDRIAEGCRERTLASPGRPNSPDYSGAYASGGFE